MTLAYARMQLYQKRLLLNRLNDPESKRELQDLFNVLEQHNINYHPLIIPLSTLDADRFIPAEAFNDLTANEEFIRLANTAVMFDLYLPDYGFVFNVTNTASYRPQEKRSGLEQMVCEALSQPASKEVDLFAPLLGSLDETDRQIDVLDIFRRAILSRLAAEDIVFPLDAYPDLRDSGAVPSNTFNKTNLGKLDSLLSKPPRK